ncbi:MAG: hypothetical protein HND58_02305 [Planctomycetota bacterium]|nr:MAG: hypothetical protein HND58_02305 [Planctomycetota bacterium]
MGHTSPGVILADEPRPRVDRGSGHRGRPGRADFLDRVPRTGHQRLARHGPGGDPSAQLDEFCASQPLAWRDLGDAIDAVTICGALPARIKTSANEFVATTDRVGRAANSPDGARWAWAGQVFGSEPLAAYRAMCSIFQRPRSTWTFDGYGSTEPWVQWDGSRASKSLGDAGLLAMLDDEPHNTAADWKLRAERPVHAGLILINSSGNRGWFDLGNTRANAGDVPLLDVPAAVHMVHSWSAVAPDRATTVAGRWLQRGAFAYIGSVHEPYLQAFVPTPMIAEPHARGDGLRRSGTAGRRAALADLGAGRPALHAASRVARVRSRVAAGGQRADG